MGLFSMSGDFSKCPCVKTRYTNSQTHHGTGIFTYIGVVSGVNAGIFASPMECLGVV